VTTKAGEKTSHAELTYRRR